MGGLMTRVFKKNDEMVPRQFGDELILVPIYKSNDDINAMYSLNRMAAYIWGMINGKRTVGDIKRHILKKYNVTAAKLDKVLMDFFTDLKKIKAVL